jgi:hypothetical protein
MAGLLMVASIAVALVLRYRYKWSFVWSAKQFVDAGIAVLAVIFAAVLSSPTSSFAPAFVAGIFLLGVLGIIASGFETGKMEKRMEAWPTLADITAALDAKLPTNAAKIANEFYTLSYKIEQFENAKAAEFYRAYDIVRQYDVPSLPVEYKQEAEKAYKEKFMAAILEFSTVFGPQIRALLERSRAAGYPDEFAEQVWNSPMVLDQVEHWGVVLSSRMLLDRIAWRIVGPPT